jgi:hypothetical protein
LIGALHEITLAFEPGQPFDACIDRRAAQRLVGHLARAWPFPRASAPPPGNRLR